jgi:hypothetical protein
MNRRLFQFQYSSVPMLTLIDAQIVIGASGAVTSFSGNLVSNVTKTATGVYKIDLKGNLNALIGLSGAMLGPSGTESGISSIEGKSDLAGTLADLSSPSVTIKTLDAAGVAANPASGSTVLVQVLGRNSSVAQ